ncbi:MAG: hypothetical protein ABW104_14555 [Candidatus Thiodiazotropha sp. 6PLUC2]
MRIAAFFITAALFGRSNVSVVIPVDGPIGIKIESEKEMETVIVNDKNSLNDESVNTDPLL